MKKLSFLLGFLVVLVLVGAACTSQTGDQADTDKTTKVEDTSPIKLGWLGPLTGDISTVGQANRKAVEMAVKEVNEAGGVNGRMIEMIYEDGACESKTAANAGSKLINVEKVLAIIGGECTGETMAIAPTAEQNKVLMISPASTAATVTEAGDYIFRVVPSDDYQGAKAADFVYNDLGKKKAAVLYGVTDYHKGLADAFTKKFEELGGEIVLTETFLQNDRDFKTQLTKIKSSEAEILYFSTYTETGLVGVKQAKELELGMQIIGAEPFDDPKFVGAEGVDGVLYTVPYAPENEEFKARYLAETESEDMPIYSTQSYDAISVLIDVMKRVGTNPEDVKNELYKVKDYQGVSGMIGFDENGDLTSAVYEVKTYKDGQPVKYKN